VAGIGIIRGHSIAKNKDGDKNRILLQVEMLEDDIRTVELMPGSGQDYNPAIGSRVFVADAEESSQIGIETTDNFEPETDPGEKEIYSTDNPVTKKLARIKLKEDGLIAIVNEVEGLITILINFIDDLKGLTTQGSASNHSVTPTSQIALEAIKTRFSNLFGSL
jgi:hypothetical protein